MARIVTMTLQPKLILLGLLALGAGAATTIFVGLGRSPSEVGDGIAGLSEGPKTEELDLKSAAIVEAAAPRPVPTSAPTPDATAVTDPRLQALMADVRTALHSIPIEKITGTDPAKVPALLADLEPVLERGLAAQVAREARRSRGKLDAAAERAFLSSASFYEELPKLAALVLSGRATVQVTEQHNPLAEGILCTNGPDGHVRRTVVATPISQWTLGFGIDPAQGATSATPRRGASRRQPFQGETNGGNGSGAGGGGSQRGRRRRGGD